MIYKNLVAAIPSNARISYTDKRVFLPKGISLSVNGKPTKNRIVIGQYIEPGKMHPTDNYKELYPSEFEELSGSEIKTGNVKIGLYAAFNSIVQSLGIYEDLESIYGQQYANAILDYCMFMVGAHTNSTIQMESFMKDKAAFSADGIFDDDWYSEFFSTCMPSEKNEKFREKWMVRCADALNIKDVYVCVDGSNNNCEADDVEIAEKGHAKSKENKDIVSFMYAVDSVTRTPIYSCEYRGGMVDSKAVKYIVDALKNQKIKVKGFIIDKGFCSEEVLDYLARNHMEYVLKLKNNVKGHTDMMFAHMEDVRFKTVCFIPGTNYFGITDKKQLFENSELTCSVHLYYDWKNGGERAITLLEKVYKEKKRIDDAILNSEDCTIDKELKDYFVVTRNNRKRIISAEINHDVLQNTVNHKGYSSLATSEDMGAAKANSLYDMRNNSEQMYMFMKSHQGFDVTHVHGTDSLYAKYMIVFIASIIRNEILRACQRAGYSTNVALNELSLLTMQLRNGKYYTVTHNESKKQLKLLKELGADISDLDQIAEKATNDNNGIIKRQKRLKPGPKKGSHRKQYDEDGNVIKRKPGPKPGSHHKTKYNKDGSPRQKPGPKPGSRKHAGMDDVSSDNSAN